ncbi:hypothetical protein ACQP3J_30335, partial [Escherichia coli]
QQKVPAQLQADVTFWSLSCPLVVGSNSSKLSAPPSDLLSLSGSPICSLFTGLAVASKAAHCLGYWFLCV